MGSAIFLLAINFSIGISFAAAFLGLTWRTDVRLGRWCAAGFVAAAAAVAVEAAAFAIPSVRLVSALSFSGLMLSVTLITAGLTRHYKPQWPIAWLFGLAAAAAAFNAAVVFDLPRGTLAQALCYQGPFAVMLAIATVTLLAGARRQAVDIALAAVLAAAALQFLAKAVAAGFVGRGPGVRDYLISTYAHYSQTSGSILSILLGLALLAVVASAVMAETARRLQRDGLSGALTRGAFLEQADKALRAMSPGTPSCVIMADLDHFKAINDRFGHAGGDEVIRSYGASLGELIEGNGLCGRIGGEEFCILMTDCSIAAARIYVDAMRDVAAMTSYARLPPDYRASASFGIAVTGPDEPIEDAMHRADIALYEAKAAGRAGYRFAPARGGAGGTASGAA